MDRKLGVSEHQYQYVFEGERHKLIKLGCASEPLDSDEEAAEQSESLHDIYNPQNSGEFVHTQSEARKSILASVPENEEENKCDEFTSRDDSKSSFDNLQGSAFHESIGKMLNRQIVHMRAQKSMIMSSSGFLENLPLRQQQTTKSLSYNFGEGQAQQTSSNAVQTQKKRLSKILNSKN